MKKVLAVLFSSFLLQACQKGVEKYQEDSSEPLAKLEGVVEDGYLKRFPYSVRWKKENWALDVVAVPREKIGVEVFIEARPKEVDGIKILTNVVLEGERLQTKKEWAESKANEFDPFGENGDLNP